MKNKNDTKKTSIIKKVSKYESKEYQEKMYNDIKKEKLEYLENTEWKYEKFKMDENN